jgi:hypothetical protein
LEQLAAVEYGQPVGEAGSMPAAREDSLAAVGAAEGAQIGAQTGAGTAVLALRFAATTAEAPVYWT